MLADGARVGLAVGLCDGLSVLRIVGLNVGTFVARRDGACDGLAVGLAVGRSVGVLVGLALGACVRGLEGLRVGLTVGVLVGLELGLAVGNGVGLTSFVGSSVTGPFVSGTGTFVGTCVVGAAVTFLQPLLHLPFWNFPVA